MEDRSKTKFAILYSKYLTWNNKDRNNKPYKEEVTNYNYPFITENQMGIWTSQSDGHVWFHNMSKVVFDNLRLYLYEFHEKEYDKINWMQNAQSIIDDLT